MPNIDYRRALLRVPGVDFDSAASATDALLAAARACVPNVGTRETLLALLAVHYEIARDIYGAEEARRLIVDHVERMRAQFPMSEFAMAHECEDARDAGYDEGYDDGYRDGGNAAAPVIAAPKVGASP